jgi:hypothetical protein
LPAEIATPFKVRSDEVPIFLMNSRVDGAFSVVARQMRENRSKLEALSAKTKRKPGQRG